MHIHALYIHPIKSLPPIALTSSELAPHGLLHDRIFLLERTDTSPPTPLLISREPALATFTIAFSTPSTLVVSHPPTSTSIPIPITPSPPALRSAQITLHSSPATGVQELVSPPTISAFFTSALGYPVRVLYLGPSGHRPILGSVAPPAESTASKTIGFSDCSPLLIVSLASLLAVPVQEEEVRRFRPNIVVAAGPGPEANGDSDLVAWEEDFWQLLALDIDGGELEVEFTANCVRCRSLDVDFCGGWESGTGRVLKRLMAGRRVDRGARWSPVFGRYGGVRGLGGLVRVGTAVRVLERNKERTVLRWPGIGTDVVPEEGDEEKKMKEMEQKSSEDGIGCVVA